jgi:hypothetical protein
MMFLSQIFQSNGNFGEAEQICKDALAIWNKDGEENSLTLAFLNNTYAQALKEDKKYDETVEAAKASIRSAEKAIVLGNDNKKAKGFKLISLFLMADSYFKQGKTVEFQETAGKILQLPASDFTWETVDVLSMIARLYAQQKDYENAEKYFAKAVDSVGGIGVLLDKTNDNLIAKQVTASGPAGRAGLKAGSKLISINGLPTKTMSLQDAELLRGPVGTQVELEVEASDGSVSRLTLTREKFSPPWVSPIIPKPDADGWITLFDGEHLYGCCPTDPCFRSGKIFVQNGSLRVDSTENIPFIFQNREAAVRVQAKMVSGQNFSVHVGRDTAWFNGGHDFGIGRFLDGRYQDLQTASSSSSFNDFFEMVFVASTGNLRLLVEGKSIVSAKDDGNTDDNATGIGTHNGISVFKRIEIKLSDVQSLFPKDEASAKSQPKPDAGARLKKVKSLYDQGLINKEDYDKKVKEIMDSL